MASEEEEDTIRFRETIKKILHFLHEYRWLLDSFIAGFFTEDLWDKLPMSWQVALQNVPVKDVFLQIMKGNEENSHRSTVLPLSLLAYVATCRSFVFPSTKVNELKDLCDGGKSLMVMSKMKEKLPYSVKKHVKPKKQYEIDQFAKVVHDVSTRGECSKIVDVGSGLGHFARLLSFSSQYCVTTVEAVDNHQLKADKFDKELELDLIRMGLLTENRKRFECICPKRVVHTIAPGSATQTFVDAVSPQLNDEIDGSDSIPTSHSNIAMIGLHTCGDLGPTILRMFTECNRIRALASVGCCYMKLTIPGRGPGHCSCLLPTSDLFGGRVANQDDQPLYGYPMSRFLLHSSCPQPINYNALELACHCFDMYAEKLKGDSIGMKLHCYRATLELIIKRVDPSMQCRSIRCSKIKYNTNTQLPFPIYVEKAFNRLGIPFEKEYTESSFVHDCLAQWKDVMIYHCLRLLLGPVVESLVLMDRYLYLVEQGFKPVAVAVFDPTLSPRNVALTAVKGQGEGVRYMHGGEK